MRREPLDLICEDLALATDGSLGVLQSLRGGRLLITGGTGFVGTWLGELTAYLNDRHGFGLRLILLARDIDEFREQKSHLAQRPEFSLVRGDVRNLRDLPPDVTWIVHAGATPDNRVHNTDPLRVADTIVGGTRAALEAAVRLPTLNGFLNLSSGLVYGPQPAEKERISEKDFYGFDPSVFGAVYAESKRQAETLCFAYANQQRLRVVNARPFAFIGPYQYLDRPWAINNFVRDGLHGGPIRILGDGATVRSYLYPADMAVWLLAILASGRSGESYNVGSAEAVTLSAAAQLVSSLLPSRPAVTTSTVSVRQSGNSLFVPETAKAATLGLREHFDFAASIRRMLQWNTL